MCRCGPNIRCFKRNAAIFSKVPIHRTEYQLLGIVQSLSVKFTGVSERNAASLSKVDVYSTVHTHFRIFWVSHCEYVVTMPTFRRHLLNPPYKDLGLGILANYDYYTVSWTTPSAYVVKLSTFRKYLLNPFKEWRFTTAVHVYCTVLYIVQSH